MSLIDRVRATAPAAPGGSPTTAPAGWWSRSRPYLRAAGHAVLATTSTLLLLLVPLLVAWMLDAHSTGSLTTPLATAADAWALGHGATVVADGVPVGITPWLLTAVPFLIAVLLARRVLDLAPAPRADSMRELARPYLLVSAAFVGGYAVMGVAVRLLAQLGPARPSWWQTILGSVLLPFAASVVSVLRERRAGRLRDLEPLALRVEQAVPAALRRAPAPAGVAVLSVLGSGMLVVAALLVVHGSRVAHLYGVLHAGIAGAVVLSIGQLAALPNLSMWAAAFLAGPGVSIGSGTYTWANPDGAVLPLLPVFGALPQPSAMPAGTWALVLVPVLCGCICGRRVISSMTRLSSWTAKVSTALAASALAGLALGIGAWASGGPLGTHRLAYLGPPALTTGLASAGEIAVGAVGYVTIAHFLRSRHNTFRD